MSKKILIIDDEKDLLLVLKRSLNAEGYSVITAETGKEGLFMAETEQPDLIVLDVALPDILGGEVAVRLRDNDQTKDIPVIFLSAMFTRTEESKRGHIVGGNVMFAKPYDMEALGGAIRNLLGEDNEYQASPISSRVTKGKIMLVDADSCAKVLLADDEEDLLRAMGMQLKIYGYDVVFSPDASSAIRVALSAAPDLIILNIGLSAGDGLYVMQNIASNPRTAGAPIIVICCADASLTERAILEAGARAFFRKPIDMDEFMKVIEDILDERTTSSDSILSGCENG
ncbi:MAG: response regulator [Planctomycetota bacterium]|jgi:DNA-binding response OmpR family regulator